MITAHKNTPSTRLMLVFTAILVVSGLARFYRLSLDPPPLMDVQFICDEGWWVHNARNDALFGRWIVDDFNQSLLVSPVYCLMARACFSIWGVHLASARLPAAVSGFGSIIVVYFILKRLAGRTIAIYGAFLIGLNYSFTSLNRVAFIDSTAFLFVCLTWLFLEMGKPGWMVAAGMAFGLAFLSKSYVVTLLPVMFVVYLRRRLSDGTLRWTSAWTKLTAFLAGTAGVLVLYYLFLVRPFYPYFQSMYDLWRSGNLPGDLHQTLKNMVLTFIRPGMQFFDIQPYFTQNLSLLLLLWFRSVNSNTQTLKTETGRKMSSLEADAWTAFAVILIEILPLTAKPIRRYIFCYLPLIVIGSRFLASKWTAPSQDKPGTSASSFQTLFFSVPFSLGFAYCLTQWIIHQRQPIKPAYLVPGLFIISFLFFMILSAVCWRSIRCRRPILWFFQPRIALILVVLIESVGFMKIWDGASTTLRDTSIELGRTVFRDEPVVLGGLAHTLALENRARPVAIWGREGSGKVLNSNPVSRFHPEYLIIIRKLDGMHWGIEYRLERYAEERNKITTLKLLPSGNEQYRVEADLYKMPQEQEYP